MVNAIWTAASCVAGFPGGRGTFGLGDLGFGLLLLLLVLGALVGIRVGLTLLALGLAVDLFAGHLFRGLALLLKGTVLVVLVAVVVHLLVAVPVVLARLLLAGLFLGSFARLPRLLLALGLLLLDLQALRDVLVGRVPDDALLAVLALLQRQAVLQGEAGGEGVAFTLVQVIHVEARGGQGRAFAALLLLLVICGRGTASVTAMGLVARALRIPSATLPSFQLPGLVCLARLFLSLMGPADLSFDIFFEATLMVPSSSGPGVEGRGGQYGT